MKRPQEEYPGGSCNPGCVLHDAHVSGAKILLDGDIKSKREVVVSKDELDSIPIAVAHQVWSNALTMLLSPSLSAAGKKRGKTKKNTAPSTKPCIARKSR